MLTWETWMWWLLWRGLKLGLVWKPTRREGIGRKELRWSIIGVIGHHIALRHGIVSIASRIGTGIVLRRVNSGVIHDEQGTGSLGLSDCDFRCRYGQPAAASQVGFAQRIG